MGIRIRSKMRPALKRLTVVLLVIFLGIASCLLFFTDKIKEEKILTHRYLLSIINSTGLGDYYGAPFTLSNADGHYQIHGLDISSKVLTERENNFFLEIN